EKPIGGIVEWYPEKIGLFTKRRGPKGRDHKESTGHSEYESSFRKPTRVFHFRRVQPDAEDHRQGNHDVQKEIQKEKRSGRRYRAIERPADRIGKNSDRVHDSRSSDGDRLSVLVPNQHESGPAG